MTARLGWTVGISGDDLVGTQCRAVIGLAPQDETWRSGKEFVGVWHATPEDARLRQEALSVVPHGRYQALAVSPLEAGRLNPPDICLVYATPGQMILPINGLQWKGYRKFDWSVVGETAYADSWGRALATGEPSLSLPCFAERRYGGLPDDEMLMALPPKYLPVAIEGLRALAKNGIRYPGTGPTIAGMLAARELGANRSVILNYANSGDVTGDRRQVVGYLSAALLKVQ